MLWKMDLIRYLGGNTTMRIFRPVSAGVLAAVIAAACSRSSAPPLTDDLKQDLAKAGGSDIQLAAPAVSRVDVVSSAERTPSFTPSPRAIRIARAPAVAKVTHPSRSIEAVESPTPAAAPHRADDIAPAAPDQPLPVDVPATGRPQAPQPSTQREPRGGWRTPGDVIRRAPFPINP